MKALPLVSLCLLTGCLSRPLLDKQSFLFAPQPPSAAGIIRGSRVLGIRDLEIAAPFQGRAFVYRTGEFSYDRDPYAEFMVAPADCLISPICDWMRDAGVFSAVAERGGALKPDTLVEIHVEQLYGDFRKSDNPAAVLAMRFEFFDVSNGVPGRPILQREYSRNIPLKARTPDALMEGWNEGLTQILDSALQDFGRSDTNAAKP
jgi:cholesterol transport system auxiliary component